jgi:alpha-amylase
MLVYDRSPRKSLVDHFYPIDVQLKDLIAGYDLERGDFVSGTYLSKAQRQPNRVTLLMERPGWVDGHPVQLSKSIQLQSNTSTIEVIYTLEDLPVGIPIHFAVELNLAGMAGHADDRYFSDLDGERLGTLDSRLDLENSAGLCLTDEWLDLNIELSWSHEAGLWCFPIETMSLNVNRYEGVYQSSVVMPHWLITADESQKWQVTIRWTIDRVAGEDTNEPSDTSQLNQSFV